MLAYERFGPVFFFSLSFWPLLVCDRLSKDWNNWNSFVLNEFGNVILIFSSKHYHLTRWKWFVDSQVRLTTRGLDRVYEIGQQVGGLQEKNERCKPQFYEKSK